jgi:hypothetical protein
MTTLPALAAGFVGAVFLVELGIMGILPTVAPNATSLTEALLDATILSLLIGPLVIVVAARRGRVEEAQRQAVKARLQEVLASSTAVTYATKVVGENFVPSWVSENITRMMGYRVEEALLPTWCLTISIRKTGPGSWLRCGRS